MSSQAHDLIPEKDLLATVVELARLLGWEVFSVLDQRHYARRLSKGFPDLVLLRPPRLAVAELKSEKGRLTRAQLQWLEGLAKVPGVETYVWRPSDLDQIELILQ